MIMSNAFLVAILSFESKTITFLLGVLFHFIQIYRARRQDVAQEMEEN